MKYYVIHENDRYRLIKESSGKQKQYVPKVGWVESTVLDAYINRAKYDSSQCREVDTAQVKALIQKLEERNKVSKIIAKSILDSNVIKREFTECSLSDIIAIDKFGYKIDYKLRIESYTAENIRVEAQIINATGLQGAPLNVVHAFLSKEGRIITDISKQDVRIYLMNKQMGKNMHDLIKYKIREEIIRRGHRQIYARS